jgi:phosphate transport system ATP-binding protein
MHELYPNITTKGEILLNEQSIYAMSTTALRRKIGMVFQRPNPFPTMSIYENVIAGYMLNGTKLKHSEKNEIVERSLRDVGLFDEVKDSLNKKGNFLSGGQQQRLCVARALAFKPDVILMDEPTSALDPLSTAKIEDLLVNLKEHYSIILVTHNMSQAARISDNAIFMYLGELIEYDKTKTMFTNPKDSRTEGYLTGKFG